jgi:hypothetical protein
VEQSKTILSVHHRSFEAHHDHSPNLRTTSSRIAPSLRSEPVHLISSGQLFIVDDYYACRLRKLVECSINHVNPRAPIAASSRLAKEAYHGQRPAQTGETAPEIDGRAESVIGADGEAGLRTGANDETRPETGSDNESRSDDPRRQRGVN